MWGGARLFCNQRPVGLWLHLTPPPSPRTQQPGWAGLCLDGGEGTVLRVAGDCCRGLVEEKGGEGFLGGGRPVCDMAYLAVCVAGVAIGATLP